MNFQGHVQYYILIKLVALSYHIVMKIFVKVKASSKNEGVTKVDELHYVVSVKAPPVEGKANEAIGKVLSDYFNVPKSHITILKGGHSKNKIIEISS